MADNMNIQWYPGHMTKTRRQMEQDLKLVDAVCEIVDARIPMSSRNPDIDSMFGSKPRIIILNRMDLADPKATKAWAAYFKGLGYAVVVTDCKSRRGIGDFTPAVRTVLAEKIARNAAKGMNKPVKVMVVGIPNVGKSALNVRKVPDSSSRMNGQLLSVGNGIRLNISLDFYFVFCFRRCIDLVFQPIEVPLFGFSLDTEEISQGLLSEIRISGHDHTSFPEALSFSKTEAKSTSATAPY